ncbi:MAG: phosphate ABC transporter substrate-binding protein [Spirochaetota bacterium]|nr:phosphate ABC transporter substrate-binding protein [Spirochaetota bacterium]
MTLKNNREIKVLVKYIILLILIALSQCSKENNREDKISIKGSTTLLPIVFRATEVFMQQNNISITISATGSGNGIKGLIDGICDIASTSRALNDKELALAKQKKMNIEEIVIAYDMIIIIVHPSNKIENLTLKELHNIYSGKITNWSQLGSVDNKIVVISRDNSSGTYGIWNKMVIKEDKIVRKAVRVAANSAMVYTVSSTPGAIGYIGLGYLNNSVKALKLNSIEPELKNGMSGKYPISRKLYMIIDKKNASEEITSFIDFMFSEKGQRTVKEAGFIPL